MKGFQGPEIPPTLGNLPQWEAFRKAVSEAPCSGETLRILRAATLSLDLSAHPYSAEVRAAGEDLLQARAFTHARDALLAGEPVNQTEDRAAWHTMLRAPRPIPEVAREQQRVREFVAQADRDGRWRTIIHIGIGGSDWGVRLAVDACAGCGHRRELKFVANLDGHALQVALAGVDPHSALVVVTSKSFTTTETLTNLKRVMNWLSEAGVADPCRQVVAITARPESARKLGIAADHIFRFWDWVGGRYSIWSAVGLPVALTVGHEVVDGIRAGAADMDRHFAQAAPADNAPAQLALAGLGNRSVRGLGSLSIAAYDARLQYLAPYLQQLDMESLGKSVDMQGRPVDVPTGPSVWGMPGTDGQHTFFQWLHQGSEGAAVDFIVCRHADHQWPEEHAMLVANCLAQRQTLLRGTSLEADRAALLEQGMPAEKAEWLASHRVHQGGRPSTLIVLPKLTPHALGALLALYEHKVFVQALIWGINPFDQWGVEAGKKMANGILAELRSGAAASDHDPSTRHWISVFGQTP
ncbi:glucose-6-phosphate isomerase [Achromobacter sp. DMS1]|uniref:glucose-6-phosphate isomerase n=1 Tax=Achromobacter sp. DMS1 TaxID=1688405 RepID=UPI00069D2F0D|nr:glucose-6-phosphate isomerase [Achromobacter sp. DMS1]KOF53908.1 glucose-6-phosphate isomerase [Achromobacter sp. DMS1]KOF53915.1 glucose-6-phosphate isomerase [Achromobacter sp. DMS1]